MIVGIGTDLVKVSRMEAAHSRRGEAFLKRLFTEREIEYCMCHENSYPFLAARFAAKEALIKALPKDVRATFLDMEVIRSAEGQPSFTLHGELANELAGMSIHLSLTHEKDYAIAFVVISK